MNRDRDKRIKEKSPIELFIIYFHLFYKENENGNRNFGNS